MCRAQGEGGVWVLLNPPVPNKNRYNSVNITVGTGGPKRTHVRGGVRGSF